MRGKRRFASYRVGKVEVDSLSRDELIAAVRMYCADASAELLRDFLKDIADEAADNLAADGYATLTR